MEEVREKKEENLEGNSEVSETSKEVSPATSAEEAPADKEAEKELAVEVKAEQVRSETTNSEVSVKKITRRRTEKIGTVVSDKMTKTVVVMVERLVKHPKYRKYVRRRKKFMAHDELGAKIGDKVKIIETRPLSARKRWRVVEILQKASG
jgi:small subunit ribosomal protein S17